MRSNSVLTFLRAGPSWRWSILLAVALVALSTAAFAVGAVSVTIDQTIGQPDPTATSPIHFTAVFSRAVQGFGDPGDVTIDGTAGATNAVITDSGDHITYDVAISGMTNSGTVIARIPAGVAYADGYNTIGHQNTAASSTDNTVTFDEKPHVVMLMPSSGNLRTTPNEFLYVRSQYIDPDGAGDIRSCFTLISDSNRSWANAVYLQYNAVTNKLYLRNDADTSWGVGYAPGTTSSVLLRNSQCAMVPTNTRVTRNGNYLTVDWCLVLKASMANKNLWGWSFVWDNEGFFDGWVKSGAYSTNLTLSTSDLNPNSGALTGVFFTNYYDDNTGNGGDDINRAYLLINDNIGQTNAILVSYNRAANKVYLKSDDGTTWSTGYTPGTPIMLENSQCKLDVLQTRFDYWFSFGLQAIWVIQLKPSMTGKQLNAWTYLSDNAGDFENWKVMGVYYDDVAPVATEFIPTSTIQTGTAGIVSGSWSDGNGYGNLERCYLLLTPQMGNVRYSLPTAQANACYVRYNAYENKIYLKNDANTSWGTGYAPGTVATLSNSQVSIDVSASALTHPDANTTKIELMVTPAWAATTTLGGWLQARDSAGALSDWTPMTPQAPSTPLTVIP